MSDDVSTLALGGMLASATVVSTGNAAKVKGLFKKSGYVGIASTGINLLADVVDPTVSVKGTVKNLFLSESANLSAQAAIDLVSKKYKLPSNVKDTIEMDAQTLIDGIKKTIGIGDDC